MLVVCEPVWGLEKCNNICIIDVYTFRSFSLSIPYPHRNNCWPTVRLRVCGDKESCCACAFCTGNLRTTVGQLSLYPPTVVLWLEKSWPTVVPMGEYCSPRWDVIINYCSSNLIDVIALFIKFGFTQ